MNVFIILHCIWSSCTNFFNPLFSFLQLCSDAGIFAYSTASLQIFNEKKASNNLKNVTTLYSWLGGFKQSCFRNKRGIRCKNQYYLYFLDQHHLLPKDHPFCDSSCPSLKVLAPTPLQVTNIILIKYVSLLPIQQSKT
jgi:hypothetical protein